ncbi:LUD domain-containing protein [Geobacter pelophilus]|uniref:LUD domain-containing protein n=1 Tax=Geoanaerobacter pelophilus TaxID=60036 RepID=A0AAW4LDH3_9BACT|nr:lactate utilization protein [Geoanaerobacter pelophilus]MBT0665186.1 LUD domain-containing protein [Geoanaerobacter pelophilus]
MSQTDELVRWTWEQKCEKAVEALGQNGFTSVYCRTANEAYDYIMKEAEDAASIGFGGSRTIVDLMVQAPLQEKGKEILNHGLPGLSSEERMAIMRRQLTCDLFLTGTNAVTLSGWLVNIDGNGNRVAAMFFGPQKVIVVAGRNKIVDGDLPAAINRIKNWASPPNAKRLNYNTPCAKTGFCSNCNSPERICRVTTVIDRKPRVMDIRVLVVNEDMGL